MHYSENNQRYELGLGLWIKLHKLEDGLLVRSNIPGLHNRTIIDNSTKDEEVKRLLEEVLEQLTLPF